ncbi:MAG: LysR family transcriptional regulator [Parvibaculales bacterium]
MISFKELRYVTLVNKYKNFSQAAKHAGVSQPALSMAISNLEEKLGIVLFYRDKNGMVRSNVFSEFLSEEGGHIINDLDSVMLKLNSINEKRVGNVVFGVGNIVADSVLSEGLVDFCQKNSDIRPNFINGYWYELREKLLRQEINFYVTANHVETVDEKITERDFMSLKINFYTRADHPLAQLKKVHCVDLIEYPTITYYTVISKQLIFEKLHTQQQINKLEKNFPAGQLESMKLALPIISQSDYLIMAPDKFFKEEIKSGQIRIIDVEDFDLKINIKLVTRSKEILSPLDNELIECLEKARDKFLEPVA